MKLTFHGAAGTVTGSRYLLEANESRVLVDAGMFQGLKQLRLLNWEKPPFDPQGIDHMLLTHAHIDHSGYLPRLLRHGFRAPVYCTPATGELCHLLLRDAAKIQEEDAAYANKKGYSKHKPAEPLYTSEDAEDALKLLRRIRYGEWLDLGHGITARYHNAGHILGAASVEVHLQNGKQPATILFSGDIGRYDAPLHLDPELRPDCDILVIESTYGDRQHDAEPVIDQIRKPFKRTFARGGLVLIPSFAVGRSQIVTLILRELMGSGDLPEVPIHIDSPMAVDATKIYSSHLKDGNLDEDLVEDGRSRLFPRKVYFHRSVKESKDLNRREGPRVIISASGMLTGGRVLHHLAQRLPDKRNLVMLAGYQAAGTRGRALVDGAKSLKMHGEYVPVRAEFQQLHGLSAHADSDELMRWLKSGTTVPRTVIITHGEPQSAQALAARIGKQTGARCLIPGLGDSYDLGELLS